MQHVRHPQQGLLVKDTGNPGLWIGACLFQRFPDSAAFAERKKIVRFKEPLYESSLYFIVRVLFPPLFQYWCIAAEGSGFRCEESGQEDLRCCLLDEKSWFMIDSWAFPIFLGLGFRDEGPWNLFLIFRVKV